MHRCNNMCQEGQDSSTLLWKIERLRGVLQEKAERNGFLLNTGEVYNISRELDSLIALYNKITGP